MMKDNGVVSPAALKLSYEWKPNRKDLISLSPLNNRRVLSIYSIKMRIEKAKRMLAYAQIELGFVAKTAADTFRNLRNALEGLSDDQG